VFGVKSYVVKVVEQLLGVMLRETGTLLGWCCCQKQINSKKLAVFFAIVGRSTSCGVVWDVTA
jgi:hypothetical protein